MSAERPSFVEKREDPAYPFDAIILLCGGVHKIRNGKWGLNFESKFKVLAAVEAYKSNLAPVVISSGGAMWGGPSLGHLMAEKLTVQHFNIPKEAILEENQATDSGIQMRNILDIIKEKKFKKVAVIADSVHSTIAVPLLRNWAKHDGVSVEVERIVMEDILIKKDLRYKKLIDKMHNSPYWGWWKFKYGRLAKTLETDPLLSSPKAKLTASITEAMRTKWPFYHLRIPGTT